MNSKTNAVIGNFAWIIPVTLICVAGVTTLAVAGYAHARFEDRTYQENGEVDGQRLDGRLKGLGALIEGNIAKVGKLSAKYDLYRYEGFRFDGCFIGWRETHESYEAGARLTQEIQELTIPLAALSKGSVRVDKLYGSAYVVSFTTLKLKGALMSRWRLTRQDGSKEGYRSFQSGGGVYFQSNNVARRVAKALVLSIDSCQKGNS